MNDEHAVAWLGRKIAWGFRPGDYERWRDLGAHAAIDALVEPGAQGIAERPDPYADLEFDPENQGRVIAEAVGGWTQAAIDSPRPLETFMDFHWADWFAVSVRSVRPPTLMFDHMRLLAREGLGNFATLLHDVTIDGAMLQFLDGARSTAGNPNENYGRELLELYSVGVGNFTEDDVQAAARSLTGWQIRRYQTTPRFRPALHDDSPQTLLGVEGVRDVAGVIDAVIAHPATADRVVHHLGQAILGPGSDPALLAPVVESFRADSELRPVVRSLLELGVNGHARPALIEPLAWFTMAMRFTGALPNREQLRTFFRVGGQTPLLPPNVGGYPEPSAYLSSSATIARFNMASALAQRSREEARELSRDVDELAVALGLPDGFTDTTRSAIAPLASGPERIAAALVSPDLLVV